MVGWRKVWNTAMHYVPRFVLRVLPPLPALCQFVVALRLHYAYTTRMSVWSETYVPAQPLVPSRAELPCVCLVELPLSSTAVLADSVSGMGTVECWGPHWLLLSKLYYSVWSMLFGICCFQYLPWLWSRPRLAVFSILSPVRWFGFVCGLLHPRTPLRICLYFLSSLRFYLLFWGSYSQPKRTWYNTIISLRSWVIR